MSNKLKEKKLKFNFSAIFFSVLVIFFLVCMIAAPAKFIQCSLDGVSAWAFNVLPSVLPFMFFTRILSSLGLMSTLTRPLSPLSGTLFKTPPISIYAFCMAILSGYPVGSKMVADLFMQGQISKEDAFKMSAFCSTSGPMFIVGAVGVGMFQSAKIGYVLFLSHLLGAVFNGILFRNFKLKNRTNFGKEKLENNLQNEVVFQENETAQQLEEKPYEQNENFEATNFEKEEKYICNNDTNIDANIGLTNNKKYQKNAKKAAFLHKNGKNTSKFDLAEIVTSSTLSILSVGCIITIFFIVIECFSPIFSLLPQGLACFLEGIIEITKGCLDISKIANINLAVTMCSFVISFGGISTVLQSLTMLSSVQMPVKLFLLQKFTHAIFATLATVLILSIL